MWPDDYIAWAQSARPFLAEGIKRLLNRYLGTSPQWTVERVTALAEQATRYAFDVANDHRRYPEYCRTEAEFRIWAHTVGLNEVLRLLIRHRLGEPHFQRLSADQRRLLGMRYLDQLPPGDMAGVLRVSGEEVREGTKQALEAFFQRLEQPDAQGDDEDEETEP
jgi:hypothetical protein